jgi:phosphate transport system substrate-binding protein
MTKARLGLSLLVILFAAGCSNGAEPRSPNDDRETSRTPVKINGMGATLPYPLYSRWFTEYNKLHPDVQINYQSQGSGAGIRGLLAGTVFFGASDQPLKDTQLAAARGVLHFPTVLGAVVPVHNLPGVRQDINFTGPLLADIVMGSVRKWNDPAIAAHNPGVALPATDITVVHRSEGSGTTFVWTDYLGKVSSAFRTTVGVDASVRWPVGIGGKGNEGVAGLVQQIPGALGYVELVWAQQNGLRFGAVQNAAGRFVKASVASVSAAAAVAKMPADFRVSITDAAGEMSYPVASFTWLLIRQHTEDAERGRIMREFLRWALTDGQKFAVDLGYPPVPPPIVAMELKALDSLEAQ